MEQNNFQTSAIELLGSGEMLIVRGGAVVPKPSTRPREVWEPKSAAFEERNNSNSSDETLLSIMLSWLKDK